MYEYTLKYQYLVRCDMSRQSEIRFSLGFTIFLMITSYDYIVYVIVMFFVIYQTNYVINYDYNDLHCRFYRTFYEFLIDFNSNLFIIIDPLCLIGKISLNLKKKKIKQEVTYSNFHLRFKITTNL